MRLSTSTPGLSVVTPGFGSLRLFHQLPDGSIGQRVHVDGTWSQVAPTFSAVPLTPLASTTWRAGQEIRVYYLDSQYIVQEHCYSKEKGWYLGDLGQLGVKVSPTSRLSAMVYGDYQGHHSRVYYQEHESHIIKELCHDSDGWSIGEMCIEDAVEGTGIAAVNYIQDDFIQIRLYYQSKDLYLKEYCHNNEGWFTGKFLSQFYTTRPADGKFVPKGLFGPGKAPLGTTIAAVASNDAPIVVFWHHPKGHIAYIKHAGTWGSTTVIKETGPAFGFAVLDWETGEHLRLYCEDHKNFLFEYSSDNGGETWVGKQLAGT